MHDVYYELETPSCKCDDEPQPITTQVNECPDDTAEIEDNDLDTILVAPTNKCSAPDCTLDSECNQACNT